MDFFERHQSNKGLKQIFCKVIEWLSVGFANHAEDFHQDYSHAKRADGMLDRNVLWKAVLSVLFAKEERLWEILIK